MIAAIAAITLDTPTVVVVISALAASVVSMVRWRSGDRTNVLGQASAEIAAAAGQTVQNLMADNQRLRSENAELLDKLENFEQRVIRLTNEISQLRNELADARRKHTKEGGGIL